MSYAAKNKTAAAPAAFALPLLLAAGIAAAAPSLDKFLDSKDAWDGGADAFMQEFAPLGFNFVSGREIARSVDDSLSFRDHGVEEAFAYFGGGDVKKISFTVYNRGDAGDAMSREDFEKLVRELGDALGKWAGKAGRQMAGDSGRGRRRHAGRTWSSPPSNVALEWAYTEETRHSGVLVPYRAEFVRVTLTPLKAGGASGAVASSAARSQVSGFRLKQNVGRSSAGDVCINGVPMVDQGQKGYCAAATSERLLRYYGRDVDQHDVAQLADTAREGGTSSAGMLKALTTIGRQYSLDVKKLYDPDWKDFQRLIRDYDKAARAKRLPPLPDYGNTIDVGRMYADMDSLALKQARMSHKPDFEAFKRGVKTYVDSGVPLIWSCIVGKFPENPPLNIQGSGGHMRIVIGYNEKTGDLLYTDSWGPGHDLKRMPMDEAWTILTGLYVLKPRDIR